ncbi:MAG TPA: ABC transporter permease [Vicinamibacterales bacterium]|nr:ABC transporter permease [Vicinamibacterales bacterium]
MTRQTRTPAALALAVRLLPKDVRADVEAELVARHAEIRVRRGALAATRWAIRQPFAAFAARLRWAVTADDGPQPPRSSGWIDDGTVALRGLRRRPGLAAVVVATVAVSVGAIGAIASVIDAVLLRPLPYAEPDRMVWLNSFERSGDSWQINTPFIGFANPHDVADWQRRSRALEAITAVEGFEATVDAAAGAVRVGVARVNATVDRVLGIRAQHGRLFTDADYAVGRQVLVMTDALFRSQFGGDPGLVGRSIPLNGRPYTVIGVLPPTSAPFPDDEVDVWLPLKPPEPTNDPRDRSGVWQTVVGRIKADSTLAAAQADMDRVAAELAAEYPRSNEKRGIALVPYRDGFVGSTRQALWMLSWAVAIVLAIASGNVGHLLLVSVQARRREFAVRLALGARSSRLARLVLCESAALAVAGGLVGVAIAPLLLRAFLAAYPDELPVAGGIALSPFALAAAAGATWIAALASAIPPLAGARSANLAPALRATDRGSDSRAQRRVRATLVLAQVAMSTALLVGGGLLLRTFLDLRATPLGFASDRLLVFNVALGDALYPSLRAETGFYRDLADRVRALPGVAAVGATTLLPLAPGDFIDGFTRVGEQDAHPNLPLARLQNVTAGYLEALGLRLVAGRLIRPTDVEGGAPIVVVNETLQRTYFPNGAIGRRIRFRGIDREIVGVVADKRHRTLREAPRADLYVPRGQSEWPRWFAWFAVRHDGRVDALLPAIRAAVREVDPRVAIDAVATMDDRLDRAIAPDRFRAFLVSALAVVALALTAIGLYGVVAYAVARDARDTAIRMALGATSGRTAGAVLAKVAAIAVAGIGIGVVVALAAEGLVSSFMSGVTARDPLTIGGVAIGLLTVALTAAAGPARRATRVDPATVLRGQ